MLDIDQVILVVVDMQGKTLSSMHDRPAVVEGAKRLVRGMQVLGVPVLRTELDPDHMGRTVADLTLLLQSGACVRKTAFSCADEPVFMKALATVERRQVILAGVETHVAVYQTARGLIRSEYRVEVAADAVTARTAKSHALGIDMVRHCGAAVTSVETALCELTRSCDHPSYRQIHNLLT